jgi:hypothetical protein
MPILEFAMRWNLARFSSFFCLCIFANTMAQAGYPYVDRFSANRALTQSGLDQPNSSSPSDCKGNCPTTSHAKLQLWVPDDATVAINCQLTKHQALGGVHRFSRVYHLSSLNALGTTECLIQVDRFDVHGNLVRMERVIWVMAGEGYNIRFPEEFVETMVPPVLQEFMPASPLNNESHSSAAPHDPTNNPAGKRPILPSSGENVPAGNIQESLPKKRDSVPDPTPSLEREMGTRKIPVKD